MKIAKLLLVYQKISLSQVAADGEAVSKPFFRGRIKVGNGVIIIKDAKAKAGLLVRKYIQRS